MSTSRIIPSVNSSVKNTEGDDAMSRSHRKENQERTQVPIDVSHIANDYNEHLINDYNEHLIATKNACSKIAHSVTSTKAKARIRLAQLEAEKGLKKLQREKQRELDQQQREMDERRRELEAISDELELSRAKAEADIEEVDDLDEVRSTVTDKTGQMARYLQDYHQTRSLPFGPVNPLPPVEAHPAAASLPMPDLNQSIYPLIKEYPIARSVGISEPQYVPGVGEYQTKYQRTYDKHETAERYHESRAPRIPAYQTIDHEYRYPKAHPVVSERDVPDHIRDATNRRLTEREHETSRRPRIEMPKLELKYFDGDVREYWPFIKQFESSIEEQVSDPRQRLLYLNNYCTGMAKRVISSCSMLPAEEGYRRARALLEKRFGQTHMVASCLMNDLMNTPSLKLADAESLSELATQMQHCEITMQQMQRADDLNASTTIGAIAYKLPFELRDRWEREAWRIKGLGREPTFSDLTGYVTDEAGLACSRYTPAGTPRNRAIEHVTPTPHYVNQKFPTRRPGPSHMVHVTSTGEEEARYPRCPVCPEHHYPSACPKFKSMNLNERWNKVNELNLCISCLGRNHRANECRRKRACAIEDCIRTHHPLLHKWQDEVAKPRPQTDPERDGHPNKVCASMKQNNIDVRLGVLPVIVSGPRGMKKTNAILDNGSNTTFIRDKLAQELGIPGINTVIRLKTMLNEHKMTSKLCSFRLTAINGKESINIEGAYTTHSLPENARASPLALAAERWSHLRDVPFDDIDNGDIDVLIGCDHPDAHRVTDQRFGSSKQPFAVRTPLGWTVMGPVGQIGTESKVVNCMIRGDVSIWHDWRQLYDHEFGDATDTQLQPSVEEKAAMSIVAEGTRYEDGHFEVPLPWRDQRGNIPNNISCALQRLQSLQRRLRRDEQLLCKYREIMETHLSKGYIREVNQSDDDLEGRVWYLPHQPVLNPKKPGKVRVVFDCAAKHRNQSLNDFLYSGPDTTVNLLGVLLRFRQYPVAIIGDIEEMFLQVRVPVKDSQALRFLWWKNGEIDNTPTKYLLRVHPFGATSSPFCANYALRRAVEMSGENMDSEFQRMAERDIYVDDCIVSIENECKARSFVKQLVGSLRQAGFRLRKWMSNNRAALADVPDSDLSSDLWRVEQANLPVERTLGVGWDAQNDAFEFAFRCTPHPMTRRHILSRVSSLFDPLGMVAPVSLLMKILLQDLCKQGLEWDEVIREPEQQRWLEWVNTMARRPRISIPRWWSTSRVANGENIQLHVFSDASEKGYGCAAYIRVCKPGGEIECNLAIAKARVAPVKSISIPRLELTAAVLAVRVYGCLKRELSLPIDEVTFWTDSCLVLAYIENKTSRFCTFVANRVSEIQSVTNIQQWRYIETRSNPADYASRGDLLMPNDMTSWIKGPKFLSKPCIEWPVHDIDDKKEMVALEYKRAVVQNTIVEPTEGLDKLMQHYSDWVRLQRAVVWLMRLWNYWLVMRGATPRMRVGAITTDELALARRALIRATQSRAFNKEYDLLNQGHVKLEGSSWANSGLKKLNPILIDGIIRMNGRLNYTSYDNNVRNQIVLPRKHHVTDLIIRHVHMAEGHSGASHILAAIREEYWVLHGAATVKQALSRCMICKRRNAAPGKQQMAPLPLSRLEPGWAPFKLTGVDFFGPLLVKRGRATEKRYGCLFTCLHIRAVHLEITSSLTTDSLMLAMSRFFSRRGKPTEIYSDNGSNLLAAAKDLREQMHHWEQDTIVNKLSSLNINWHFRPPLASHRGGIWERMIRSVRRILVDTIRPGDLDDEMLYTYLVQAERIINDRPLVQVGDGVDEFKVLRPSDLLRPRGDDVMIDGEPMERIVNKRWKQVQHRATVFWKRWLKEYLPTLQLRQKWLQPNRNFQNGDVVLVSNMKEARRQWPLGIVDQVEKDADGLVRTVWVRTNNETMRRDIRYLCLLEAAKEAEI